MSNLTGARSSLPQLTGRHPDELRTPHRTEGLGRLMDDIEASIQSEGPALATEISQRHSQRDGRTRQRAARSENQAVA
ncbi:MAG: hypothetical protein H6729_02250 [Deltaproteobacteria bacterium]|nr:hypothetical protein [Deltaproteobacteria bacterium]